MKNKLTDLNNHLFAQLERLGDEGLSPEQIDIEARRADAIVDVAAEIIRTAAITLRAAELVATHGERFHDKLPMLPSPEK